MYKSPLDVCQHPYHQFDIPFLYCLSDSRGKKNLIDTINAAWVDEPRRADGVRFYCLDYWAYQS